MNDEILSLNVEVSAISHTNDLLKIDNANLLQRWLDKMNLAAEEMNHDFEREATEHDDKEPVSPTKLKLKLADDAASIKAPSVLSTRTITKPKTPSRTPDPTDRKGKTPERTPRISVSKGKTPDRKTKDFSTRREDLIGHSREQPADKDASDQESDEEGKEDEEEEWEILDTSQEDNEPSFVMEESAVLVNQTL